MYEMNIKETKKRKTGKASLINRLIEITDTVGKIIFSMELVILLITCLFLTMWHCYIVVAAAVNV